MRRPWRPWPIVYASRYADRVRKFEIERDEVIALPGIAGQPLARRFLDAWERRVPAAGSPASDERRADWLRARDLGPGRAESGTGTLGMIRSLTFHGFGKFGRETFELSPVTVVFGPNEAGKTTFFDGLFQALCRPSEAKKAGKLLKERYGAARLATAVLANDAPITDEEFLNLYAIRAGDLNLRLDQGTDWIEKLKARLFHGGLDPAALISEFQKRSSDSRSVAINKELEKAREAAARTRAELEKLRREREGHLAGAREVAAMEESLSGPARAHGSGAGRGRRGWTGALEAEERLAQRQKLAAQLARWEEWAAWRPKRVRWRLSLPTAARISSPWRAPPGASPKRLGGTR